MFWRIYYEKYGRRSINPGGVYMFVVIQTHVETRKGVISLVRDPMQRVSIVHTYRETNRCADFLARKGYSASSFDWIYVQKMCHVLGLLLANDIYIYIYMCQRKLSETIGAYYYKIKVMGIMKAKYAFLFFSFLVQENILH